MDLKLSNDLFLGLAELKHLKLSLKEEGYEKIIQQMVTSYGVVRSSSITNIVTVQLQTSNRFTALQPVASGLGKITVKAGKAVDKNLDVIDVKEDQDQILNIAADGVKRYVTVAYRKTVNEQGTIDVQADGTIVGTGTNFTERLRGQSNFPSKIRIIQPTFAESINTALEVIEYEIQSVQSDTLATLNVAQGTIAPSTDKKFQIVGSFTPATIVPSQNKYPLESDGYIIRLRLSDDVEEGIEFVLGEVVYDGIAMTITDRRLDNLFSVWDPKLLEITDFNPVIGVENIKYDNLNSDGSKNLVRLGWGIKSINGNWSINPSQQNVVIQQGSGGAWDSINPSITGFAAVDTSPNIDRFKGWRLLFEQTGQIVEIQSSNNTSAGLVLGIDFEPTYPTQGSVYIIPDCDMVELRITNITNPTADREISFSTKQAFAIVPVEAGSESNIQYRHIKGDLITPFRNINNGDYINEEAQLSSAGISITASLTTSYTQGNVTPTVNANQNTALLDRIINPGFIIDFFGSEEQAEQQEGFVICDGRTITKPGSPFDGQLAPDLSGRVTLMFDDGETDYEQVGNIGGSASINLTVGQLPTHSHSGSTAGSDGAHTHTLAQQVVVEGAGDNALTNLDNIPGGGANVSTNNDGAHTHNFTTQEVGDNQDIDVRQPFFVLFKLMKI